MESGMLSTGETVTLKVNEQARRDTEKNHSATHLLQKALKTVLGSHVEQKGSLVTPDRLRFDFAHFQAMTPEEIAQTETLVNKEIQAALPVVTDVMDIEEAKKSGAMALFGEKYDQKYVLYPWVISQKNSVVVHMLKTQVPSCSSKSYLRQVLQQGCVVLRR